MTNILIFKGKIYFEFEAKINACLARSCNENEKIRKIVQTQANVELTFFR